MGRCKMRFAGARGASLALDAATLRSRYEKHSAMTGPDAEGLATFALRLAASPDSGSVRVSKADLAHLMADRILEDLRNNDADELAKVRPVVKTLISIFRVT